MIINIVLGVILFALCIETYIYFRKNDNKKVENISKQLITRIDISTVLMIIICVLSVINIIITSK